MNDMAPAKLTIKELDRRLRAEFPEMFHARSGYVVEELWHGGCRVRKHFHPGSLRPGGTLSGPTMMALADFGIYVAILATVGWVPAAVTTNLNINFLKKPAARDLVAEARLSRWATALRSQRSASAPMARRSWSRTPPEPIRSRRCNNTIDPNH
jgi:acyl-coenzyme A thioesterase PaaI-like protein